MIIKIKDIKQASKILGRKITNTTLELDESFAYSLIRKYPDVFCGINNSGVLQVRNNKMLKKETFFKSKG